MFEKITKIQLIILSFVLAFGLMFAVKIATGALSKDTVTVTGSANQIVKSDSGSIYMDISSKKPTKQASYAIIKKQLPIVLEYLKKNGITDIDVKTSNGYYNYKYDSKTGMNTNIIESYNMTQPIVIRSNDVEKIKFVSLDIQNLIEQGIDLNVSQPDYFYSKLPELKIKLLQEAALDAKQRATAMLKASRNSVGKIQSLRMGVFQVTTIDSTDVSDMGINDTSSIDKRVTAVSNVTFRIK